MDQRRMEAEARVLKDYLPSNVFRFIDMDTDNPYIVMAVHTKKGNVYTLRIDLNDYPYTRPEMYVVKMLCDRNGNELKEWNARLYVLQSKYGYTHIYYGPWDLSISIYKLYCIGHLWLTEYESFLETGEAWIDYEEKVISAFPVRHFETGEEWEIHNPLGTNNFWGNRFQD